MLQLSQAEIDAIADFLSLLQDYMKADLASSPAIQAHAELMEKKLRATQRKEG